MRYFRLENSIGKPAAQRPFCGMPIQGPASFLVWLGMQGLKPSNFYLRPEPFDGIAKSFETLGLDQRVTYSFRPADRTNGIFFASHELCAAIEFIPQVINGDLRPRPFRRPCSPRPPFNFKGNSKAFCYFSLRQRTLVIRHCLNHNSARATTQDYFITGLGSEMKTIRVWSDNIGRLEKDFVVAQRPFCGIPMQATHA